MNTFEQLKEVEIPEGVEISYEKIVTSIRSLLADTIFKNPNLEFFEKYTASKKGDVACGTICAKGIGIHFTHSYNKQLKLQLSLVCYGKTSDLIYTTSQVKIHSLKKGATFETLLEDITAEIQDGKAATNFRGLRQWMDRSIAWPKMINFVGYLFFNDGFLTPTQASTLQTSLQAIKLDSNLFSENSINGMTLFKALSDAIDETSPKVWLNQNRELYDIVMRGSDKPQVAEEKPEIVQSATSVEEKEEEAVDLDNDTQEEIEKKLEGTGIKVTREEVQVGETNVVINTVNISKPEVAQEIKDNLQKFVDEKPKKGLGVFSKISKSEIHERTGKARNVIVQTEPETFERETEQEQIEEQLEQPIESVEETSEIVDDSVDFEIEETVDDDLVDDDFDLEAVELEDEIDEEETISLIDQYANGHQPSITVQNENYTEYYVSEMNMTVVVEK